MSKDTVRCASNWLCWPMFDGCCPGVSPFCWSVIENSGQSKSCANWITGVGTTSCVSREAHTSVWLKTEWKDFNSFIQKPSQSFWLGQGFLAERNIYPISLLVHWKVGEEEPWRLATNLPDRPMALQAYVRRMWIK